MEKRDYLLKNYFDIIDIDSEFYEDTSTSRKTLIDNRCRFAFPSLKRAQSRELEMIV